MQEELPLLNREQQAVLDAVLAGRSFFFSGCAGNPLDPKLYPPPDSASALSTGAHHVHWLGFFYWSGSGCAVQWLIDE